MKDSGGGMSPSGVCFSVVVNEKWGYLEVDAGHRRQQTGSNWREPASLSPPTAVLSMEGKMENHGKESEGERGETRESPAKERHGARE